MLYKLESLRGVAACLVVIFHSSFIYGNEEIAFVANSYLFVDFFFILSGFVMALAYSSRIKGDLHFKEYSILRLGRVYPLHLIMLLLWLPYILIKQYLFDSGFGGTNQLENNNVSSFISNVFLINSMGVHGYLSWNIPAWSISTEFFTYIVFYWITVLIDKKNSLILPLLISLSCYTVLILLDRENLKITYDYGIFRCIGAFYIGVFVHRVSDFLSFPAIIKANLSIVETICILSLIIFVSLANIHFLFFIPVIFTFTFLIYVFSHAESGIWGRVLLTNPLRKIGLWSFSIYMVHALVLAVADNIFEHIVRWELDSALGLYALVINTFMLAVVIIISKYSYLMIEKVFRDKSRVLADKYK